MIRIYLLRIILSGLMLAIFSCQDDLQSYKYDRPGWLTGKVYTQMVEEPDISTFVKCVELAGYDKILDLSGSYTVFAPSNEAFDKYFASNPNYKTLEDIPRSEIERLVKYHIIQNSWTKKQLRSLDIYGWIDTLDINNNQPAGFKRETLLLEDNMEYGLSKSADGLTIVDTTASPWHRRVAADSRKHVPIFYSEYFDIYGLSSSDYSFYFNRTFEGGNNIYFAGAKITSDHIFAENGIIYVIDRVVSPLRTAYKVISEENNLYSNFLDLINLLPEFRYNQQKTSEQSGFEMGFEVDSLFDLSFPDLAFDLANEITKAPEGGDQQYATIRYHHGMMAPANQAYNNFIDEYIKIPNGWGSIKDAPRHIKRLIANSYLSAYPIYPADYTKGFLNGESDVVKLEESNIIQREYGSNATFIGLDKAIVPRAFGSITGPVYTIRGFSKIMYAIEQTGLLPALKRENQDYMFYIESDINTNRDSSLLYDTGSKKFSLYLIPERDPNSPDGGGGLPILYRLSDEDVRTLLLNHVAVGRPKGISRKEFIPNLADNYIIINNETGEVSGTSETTLGYEGHTLAPNYPTVLSERDNGTTFEIQNWFSFRTSNIFTRISTNFPKFHELLKKAGLSLDREYRYSFISNNEFYTIFIPTDEAIDNANLNSLPVEELKNKLLFHFIQNQIVFTDGNKPAGYYETLRKDEKSTPFSTVYSKMYIEPDFDIIRFKNKNGSVYTEINESESTNILAGINLGKGNEVFPEIYNNAVIHKIDKVLEFEELDVK